MCIRDRVGSLLQALLDLHQAGLVGAVALSIQRPRQRLIGFLPVLLGVSLQASLFPVSYTHLDVYKRQP